MLSLKLDVLFEAFERVRELPARLNTHKNRSAPDADPRELQRMQDELRLAREQVRMQITRGRLLW